MGKLKKISSQVKKPPLSVIDKLIYYTIIILNYILMVVLILCVGKMLNTLLFFDESIVAGYNRESIINFVPIVLVITMTPCCIAGYGLRIKQPIIGNKKFKPNILKPTIKIYPLFSKEFKEDLSYKSRKKIKRIAKTVFIAFLVSVFIVPFGIFPKVVLDSNNNCATYNSFNQITDKRNLDDANEMEIAIVKRRYRASVYYVIKTSFVFEDKVYNYYIGYYKGDTEESLRYILQLKKIFEDNSDKTYKIIGIDKMEKMMAEKEYSNTEQSLIYELFDYDGY